MVYVYVLWCVYVCMCDVCMHVWSVYVCLGGVWCGVCVRIVVCVCICMHV